MKKIPSSIITLLIVLLSILTATNNQAFSQITQKNLSKKVDLQYKANTSLIELVKLQQDENILLRKENVNLTDKNKELTLDRDKYKLKTKKRTKALLIAIPISLGTGYILSFFTP